MMELEGDNDPVDRDLLKLIHYSGASEVVSATALFVTLSKFASG